MIIIPAIDIYENKVVRLTKGSFDTVTFYKNTPLQRAKEFEASGFTQIHVVDLTGSKTGKFSSLGTLSEIKKETSLIVQFGGGIRDFKTAKQVFDAGADFAIIGSLAIKNRTEFEAVINANTPGKIIVAIDVLNEKIHISGWTETTEISLKSHIDYCTSKGIKKFLCTDISKDGMLAGTNIELYEKILDQFPDIQLIASGGIKDIDEVIALKKLNPYAVVIGKAIYEEKINLKELASLAV
jgi:phosphoribosylformimino-5-aminoimidazole carboxamide ribotide isomerase